MAYDDGCTVKRLDSFLQHILRRHVQVIRGLVQNQQVYRFQQQAYHGQTTSLATTQHLHTLVRCLATKHKGTQYVVDAQTNVVFRHIVYGLEYRQTLVQQLGLVLGKVAYLHIVPYFQVTLEGNFTHDTLHQRRLTLSVLSHKGHLFTSFDGQVHVVKHQMGIGLLHLVADDGIVPGAQTGRELQMHGRIVNLVHLNGNYLLQLFDFLLYLHSLRGLIAETVYEGLHVLNLLLLVLVGALLLLTTLPAQHHILVVLDLVVYDATTRYL